MHRGGLAISQAIDMLRDADAHDGDISAPAPAASSGWTAMCHQLLDALADVNLRQAHLLVNTICTLFPIETVVLELFRPVLIEIGERWARAAMSAWPTSVLPPASSASGCSHSCSCTRRSPKARA